MDKGPGDRVFAGTVNGHGALEVRTTARVSDTTLARILHTVEDAQAARAPVQSLIERFARIYTPAVLGLAALVAVLPPLAGAGAWETWLYRALALVVIACPCALVISTPVTLVSALTGAARAGVLIKGGARLEALARIDTVAFDKTGTLTEGRPALTDVIALDGLPEGEVLRLAAAVERHSEHPVARAISGAARERQLAPCRGRGVPGAAGMGGPRPGRRDATWCSAIAGCVTRSAPAATTSTPCSSGWSRTDAPPCWWRREPGRSASWPWPTGCGPRRRRRWRRSGARGSRGW